MCKTQNLSPYYWGSNALQPQAFALQPRHSCDKPQLLAETLSTIFFSFFQIFDKQPRHSCPHRFARVGFSQEAGCCSSQRLSPNVRPRGRSVGKRATGSLLPTLVVEIDHHFLDDLKLESRYLQPASFGHPATGCSSGRGQNPISETVFFDQAHVLPHFVDPLCGHSDFLADTQHRSVAMRIRRKGATFLAAR